MEEVINDITKETINYSTISETLDSVCNKLEAGNFLKENKDIIVNDKLTFQKGDLVVLGSRPHIGKTGFTISLIKKLAINQSYPVGIISPDTKKQYIALRLLSQMTEIEYDKLKYDKLSKKEISKIKDASKIISNCPIYINDQELISIKNIIKVISELNSTKNINIFFIDGISLIKEIAELEIESFETNCEYSDMMVHLLDIFKQLAVELNIVIIINTNLSRSGTSAQPTIRSFIGLSTIVRKKADKILILHRNRCKEKYEIQSYDLFIYRKTGPFSSISNYYYGPYILFGLG